jgi:hypothetical protein
MQLWQIAKFLEEIPSRLPFASRPRRRILPVGEFSDQDIAIYASWLSVWFLMGVSTIWAHNSLAGLCYLVLGPAAYVGYLYLACTKCPYYGKTCYMGGGSGAKLLFQARPGDYTLLDDLLIPILWIVVSAYPVYFLFRYRCWTGLVAYLIANLGFHIFHKRNICSKCLNVKCALNPRFAGRSGRRQRITLRAGSK